RNVTGVRTCALPICQELQLLPKAQFQWGQGQLVVDKTNTMATEQRLYLPVEMETITLAPVPKGARLKIKGHHRQVREIWRTQGLPPWRRLQTPGVDRKRTRLNSS